jgi:hypothetical protein
MADLFPMPDSNMTGMMSLIQHTNIITEGWFGAGILLAFAIISMISTKNFSTEKSFAFTSFLCFLVGLLFRFMDIINDTVFYITIIALAGSIVWLVISREQEQPI